MAKKIILKPIKEWEEKEGGRPLGSIRIYIGGLHVATAYPVRKSDKYTCDWMIDIGGNSSKLKTLEEIRMEVELSIKEFINKVLNEFQK